MNEIVVKKDYIQVPSYVNCYGQKIVHMALKTHHGWVYWVGYKQEGDGK